MPDEAIPLPNGWFAADLGEGYYEIFDANGTAKGIVILADDIDIQDCDIDFIEANLIPLGDIQDVPEEPARPNPQTGDALWVVLGLLLTAAGAVIFKKRFAK